MTVATNGISDHELVSIVTPASRALWNISTQRALDKAALKMAEMRVTKDDDGRITITFYIEPR